MTFDDAVLLGATVLIVGIVALLFGLGMGHDHAAFQVCTTRGYADGHWDQGVISCQAATGHWEPIRILPKGAEAR